MHQVIVDGLEEYLSGNPGREFQNHLATCPDCRRELIPFEDCSELFRVLEPSREIEPVAGFAARVMNRVAAQPAGFWNVFSFEPAFFRRVAFASLLLLACLGGILVTQESSYVAANGPERLMTSDTLNDDPPAVYRDRMLVRLASYPQ